ncbi:MAG: hypothetical protein V4683_08470 [Bacteroidota bacterium]
MKKITISVFLLSMILVVACKKSEIDANPNPQVTIPKTFNGCRILQETTTETGIPNLILTYLYSFNDDGYITQINTKTSNSTTNFMQSFPSVNLSYKDGILVSLETTGYKEQYEYTDEALTRISVPIDANLKYLNYEIKIDNDANKRIIKMTDKNNISDIKRDVNGNIIEVKLTNISTKEEVERLELSDYDGKKSLSSLFKGWRFYVKNDVDRYMVNPFFSAGLSGNPRQIKQYIGGKLETTYMLTYEYSKNDFPIKLNITNQNTQKTETLNYSLAGCD